MKKINIKTGDKFTAVINNVSCEGLITVSGERIWLCQNEQKGSIAENLHGYKYSWVIRNNPYLVTKNITGEYLVHINSNESLKKCIIYISSRNSRIEALYKEV